MKRKLPNALQRTAAGRRGCNRCVSWRAPGSSPKPRLECLATRRRANVSAVICQDRIGLGFALRFVQALRCSRGGEGLALALKNGRPGFDQVTGQSAWAHMQSNPQTRTIFNEAMRALSA